MNPSWLRRFARSVRAKFAFPLLAKELTEAAARKRTYVLRVVYAVALYALFALLLPPDTWARLGQSGASQPNDLSILGTGGVMFETLMILQNFGVILFLPALMCGRITMEKERDSLVLLFLTDLSPWAVVLQKYLGGLVAMFSFFLLSLPLAGVAYAFGGVDTTTIFEALLTLVLLCLFVGAIALLCSAWCRSTVGAFVMTYLAGALPVLLMSQLDLDLQAYLLPVGSLALLAVARGSLVSRALVPPVNFIRPLFERVDRTMKRLNRATGGIELWNDTGKLPEHEPVFWRETHGKVLGKLHYLLRLLCLVEIPTIFLCLFAASGPVGNGYQWGYLSAMLGLLSILVVLLVSVHAANSIVSERVGQSLEVLLTTPLSAREIIWQKERALWRIMLIAAVPLLTVVCAEAYSELDTPASYLVCAVSLIAIYLPMISWLSLWISLRVRTRFQAIIAAIGTLTAWAALAPLLLHLTAGSTVDSVYIVTRSGWRALVLLSPASVGYLNEFNQLSHLFWPTSEPWLAVLANIVLYGGIALFFRWRLYANAESLLRR